MLCAAVFYPFKIFYPLCGPIVGKSNEKATKVGFAELNTAHSEYVG